MIAFSFESPPKALNVSGSRDENRAVHKTRVPGVAKWLAEIAQNLIAPCCFLQQGLGAVEASELIAAHQRSRT
jgi:hypothetical protein